MAALSSMNETLEDRFGRIVSTMPLLETDSVQIETAVGSVVSPIHRGVESACYNADTKDQSMFLKARFPDMDLFFDEAAVLSGASRASDLGIGPRLLDSLPDAGGYLFARLGEGWRWGKVDDFENPQVLENTVLAKKTLHQSERFESERSVFTTIESYLSIVQDQQIKVPGTVAGMAEKVRQIAKAIAAAGVNLAPCHGDGVSSNVMVSSDLQVQLVDFDLAGNADPYFDLGSMIVEISQSPDHSKRVIEIYDGQCRDEVYNRCRLYGIADDLMWALWGFISFVSSSRSEIEFVKYAEWRLLRGVFHVDDPDFDRWIGGV